MPVKYCPPNQTPAPPAPPPVLPKCDVSLNDGVFPHATVTVAGGCIMNVTAGTPLVYSPDPCCGGGSGGGGGGGGGQDGDPGPPGESATITVGTVDTLAPGQPATVVNSGTTTHAVLNFGIPRGADGGSGGGGGGGESVNDAGIVFTNGLLTDYPTQWPPILTVSGTTDLNMVSVFVEKEANANVKIQINGLDAMYNALVAAIDAQNNTLQSEIDALTSSVQTLQQQIQNLQSSVTIIQQTCC